MKEEEFTGIKDTTLNCVECSKDFLFSISEAQFFLSKGLQTPKRCKDCRHLRRLTIGDATNTGQ